MMRRGLFQGGEWASLVLLSLVGLAAIGFIWAQYQHQGGAVPAEGVEAEGPRGPLPPAEAGPEFAGILDREPIRFGETLAYAELVSRARRTPREELERVGRRDVLFRQVVERPQRYRGLPFHLEGTTLQVARLEDIPVTISPGGYLYEAWITTRDSQGYPSCLVFEELPAGLSVAERIRREVAFDGYFFKLMAYEGMKSGGGTVRRFAPVYVGRIRSLEAAGGGDVGGRAPIGLDWRWLAVGALLVYLTVRWAGWLGRQFQPIARPQGRRARNDVISPEALQAWIEERGGAGGEAEEMDAPDEERERGAGRGRWT